MSVERDRNQQKRDSDEDAVIRIGFNKRSDGENSESEVFEFMLETSNVPKDH